jgi:hypothetical protein
MAFNKHTTSHGLYASIWATSAQGAIVASARRDRACLFHDQKLVNVGLVPSLATRGRARQVSLDHSCRIRRSNQLESGHSIRLHCKAQVRM